eukprot:SAG31_NODE_838_length_11617_cov_36.512936_3_plen_208_part_00
MPIEWPILLVAVPWSVPATRLLEKGLIMVQQGAGGLKQNKTNSNSSTYGQLRITCPDLHQPRSNRGQPPREGKSLRHSSVAPQATNLYECTLRRNRTCRHFFHGSMTSAFTTLSYLVGCPILHFEPRHRIASQGVVPNCLSMQTLSRLVPYISRLKSRISLIVAQKRESNPVPVRAPPAIRLGKPLRNARNHSAGGAYEQDGEDGRV